VDLSRLVDVADERGDAFQCRHLVEHPVYREGDALVRKLLPEEAAEAEGEDAGEEVDPDAPVGPVEDRPDAEV